MPLAKIKVEVAYCGSAEQAEEELRRYAEAALTEEAKFMAEVNDDDTVLRSSYLKDTQLVLEVSDANTGDPSDWWQGRLVADVEPV